MSKQEKLTYKDILHKYWGYPDFRGIQKEVIESIGLGKDTLGLMPTGGGKSLTFQIPALAKKGVCIVITPLISLMKDQVDHLKKQGVLSATIHSGMSRNEIVTTLENCIFGSIKLLYISPERLSSDLFQAKLKHIKISFITVDEAHCISQWGYDFRPAYLNIAKIRRLVPNSPILALTATATPAVIKDIQQQLEFREENVFKMSFERKNLAYVLRKTEDKLNEMLHILQSVKGTAIIYCRSRKRTKELATLLLNNNISATWYHAGLEPTIKDKRQTKWQKSEVRVMVATNAFGMGIDKPDVRLVIHVDFPNSIEEYFQEAGRAGRDGNKSYAILLYTPAHDENILRKRIDDTFPPKEYIRQVYEHLAYFYQIGVGSGHDMTFEFPIDKFCVAFKHFPIRVNSALHLLRRAGYIEYEPDPDTKAKVHFLLGREDLYKLSSLSGYENKIIISLLRNYGGLFTDYSFIDEGHVAEEAGLDHNQTYLTLQNLAKKRIIDFIPRKDIPLIRYTKDREDGKDIILNKNVYEDSKERFVARIMAIINYAQNGKVCRSRQLLKYFGEIKSEDCCQCDVCLEHQTEKHPDMRISPKEQILTLLSDGKKHLITELKSIRTADTDADYLKDTLRNLLNEEEISMDGSFIQLNMNN